MVNFSITDSLWPYILSNPPLLLACYSVTPAQPPFRSSSKKKIWFWPSGYWNWSGGLSSSLSSDRDSRFQFLKWLNLPPFTDERERGRERDYKGFLNITVELGDLLRRLYTIDGTIRQHVQLTSSHRPFLIGLVCVLNQSTRYLYCIQKWIAFQPISYSVSPYITLSVSVFLFWSAYGCGKMKRSALVQVAEFPFETWRDSWAKNLYLSLYV